MFVPNYLVPVKGSSPDIIPLMYLLVLVNGSNSTTYVFRNKRIDKVVTFPVIPELKPFWFSLFSIRMKPFRFFRVMYKYETFLVFSVLYKDETFPVFL